jgi:hypothetical protein
MNSGITTVLAVAGLGLGGYAVLQPNPPVAPQQRASGAEEVDSSGVLLERIGQIEDRLADLEARPRRRRARRGDVPTGHRHRAPNELGHPDDPVHDEPEAELPPMNPVLEAQVRQLVQEQRTQHREKRHEKRLTKFKTRVADKLAGKVEEGLFDEEVADQFAAFLVAERETMHAVFSKMRSGDLDHREARAELGSLREKTEAAVAEQFGEQALGLLGDLSPLPMHRRPPPKKKE